jgi:alkanesulfonate monooxygenase SsuD/methylene tetrahydromethanopterin reductase-like flavin-dependent oxidoreductase (luciferase family)
MMDRQATLHPWVASIRDRITFGVQLIARRGEPEPGKKLVAAAKVVDDLGFEALYLGDHPAWAPDPWTHFAAVAMVTSRIRLGPMVAASPYRTPLLTARLVSDVDHLSDGRVLMGLGIGWNASDYGLGTNEFDRMGLPYPSTAERQAALEEAITVIRRLWGPEPFSFDGTHFRALNANVPAPVQEPEPPLILAGGGEKVTLRQVARLADMANFGPGPAGGVDSPAVARHKHEVLKRHCEEAGRPYDDILRSLFSHWVMVAPSEHAVAEKIARYFPEGLDEFWGKYLVSGTPEQIAALFQEYVDAGIQHFDCQVLDTEDLETFTLLIQNVLPSLTPYSSR